MLNTDRNSGTLKKMIISLLIILFTSLSVFCQNENYPRLRILGSVSELGISPSEEIWIATKAGNVYYTKHIGELWKLGSMGTYDILNLKTGDTFERINFFSEDTMMISGFIQDNGKQDFVYWSANHGKTWEKVVFGENSWLDAAFINNKGSAWASGSSRLIYYTRDYGKTWTSFDKVEQTGNLRFSTIHFEKDEKTGLFGSFWNILYRTRDNCLHWEKLPTPLDQNKYKRLSKNERPEIRKVRILGNYYFINQEDKIYVSKADSIVWKYLPNVIDFEVSNNEHLYTINRDFSVELFDNTFSLIWKSENKLDDVPLAIAVKNEKLFALTFENIYEISPVKTVVSNLFTNEIPITEPWKKVSYIGNDYGLDGKDILKYNINSNQWVRYMTADFPLSNATVFEGKLIVTDNALNHHFAVNVNDKTLEKFDLPLKLFNTNSNKVVEFHFENGSQGCFHHDNDRRSYKLKGDKFELERKTANSEFLPAVTKHIDQITINNLLATIDTSRYVNITISDLDITKNDVEEFKVLVDNEEQKIKKSGIDPFYYSENLYSFPGEYTDFKVYKNICDSLYSLPDEFINDSFWQESGNWSTTTNWRRLIFVFQDGKKLVVENSDDKPNYLYTPWTVDYDGLKFKTNSIRFGQQIEKLTDGKFFMSTFREKKYAIFKIADFIYRKRMNYKK
jgi:hypothetical protein